MKADGPRARPASRLRPRLLLLGLVTLALAPGTLLRTPTGNRREPAVVSAVALPDREGVSGPLRLTGVWEMESRHAFFGGFSALAFDGGTRLVAGTDRGFLLDIDLAGGAPRAVAGSFRFVGISSRGREEVVDLESLARDPASGTLWAGFEADNLVMRLAPDGTRRTRAPQDMAHWRKNSGAETMVRLADGRFVVIAEGTLRGSATLHEGLRFPGDPLGPARAERFLFEAPADYDPVDAAQLPDGRVLILLRRVRYAIPARFDTAIAIADPARIGAGQTWRARLVQRLSGGIFADNFEGIAFVPSARDPARGAIWLISDDNMSVFQRSLLVRFDWRPPSAAQSPRLRSR